MDHFTHTIVSRLIFSLRKFATFAYYAINGFISITTLPTLLILLRIIFFRFSIIGPYGGVLGN